MKEQISLLSEEDKQLFINNESLIAINYNYLKEVGINKPELLISLKPELFIMPNKLVKDIVSKLNITAINDDPSSIFDYID